MLVLTRKSDQKVVIGTDKKVVVTILKVQGGMVSLGFEADRDTPIYREELLVEIEQENAGGAVEQQESVELKGIAKGIAKKLKLNTRHPKKRSNPTRSPEVASATSSNDSTDSNT